MSPSKMRRSQWYQEGQTAFHCAEERDPTPNPYASDTYGDRAACWSLGFEEAKEEEARRVIESTPTPVEEAVAHGAFVVAVDMADDMDDFKAILRGLAEAAERHEESRS